MTSVLINWLQNSWIEKENGMMYNGTYLEPKNSSCTAENVQFSVYPTILYYFICLSAEFLKF